MTLDEIYSKLKSLNIPVAYLQFQKPQKLPFIAYYESHTVVKGADNYNLFRITEIKIELYSDKKNPDLERKIENLFFNVEIEKSMDSYIKDENMFLTVFSFETVQKILKLED